MRTDALKSAHRTFNTRVLVGSLRASEKDYKSIGLDESLTLSVFELP